MSVLKNNYGSYKGWVVAAVVVLALSAATVAFCAIIAYGLAMPIDRYDCHRYAAQSGQRVKYDIPGITCYVHTDRGWIDKNSLYVNKND